MPRWLCNSLVLTSVTKLKKRNDIIIQSWIFLLQKKPIFNWEIFVSSQPIFCARPNLFAAYSAGAVRSDPSHVFFLLRFPPAPGNRKKNTTPASLTLTTKKGGWSSWLNPWVGKFAHFFGGRFFGCFWLGAGRSREVKWFFKMIRWYAGEW